VSVVLREVAIVAEKQDVIFRGTKGGLELVLSDAQEFGVLKAKLKDHLKRAEFFFQGSDVVLDTGEASFSLDEILEIQDILAYPYGLKLKRIVHNEDLVAKPDRPRERARDARKPAVVSAPPPASRPAVRPAYSRPAPVLPQTLLYKGTVRSGQDIDYEGNVVIVGDVNPGAEVKATGDIVILGALRGLAHAGAGGNHGVVVASRLEPTQLRIGDVIGRPPEGGPASGREPEVARLKDGMIVIEPLEGTRWEGER